MHVRLCSPFFGVTAMIPTYLTIIGLRSEVASSGAIIVWSQARSYMCTCGGTRGHVIGMHGMLTMVAFM